MTCPRLFPDHLHDPGFQILSIFFLRITFVYSTIPCHFKSFTLSSLPGSIFSWIRVRTWRLFFFVLWPCLGSIVFSVSQATTLLTPRRWSSKCTWAIHRLTWQWQDRYLQTMTIVNTKNKLTVWFGDPRVGTFPTTTSDGAPVPLTLAFLESETKSSSSRSICFCNTYQVNTKKPLRKTTTHPFNSISSPTWHISTVPTARVLNPTRMVLFL